MVMVRRKRCRGVETEKQEAPPLMLLSVMLPEESVRDGVLDFLDRTSVLHFMAVEEFSKMFHLRRCFCVSHGNKVGPVKNVKGGTKKKCEDCQMEARGKLRCGKCDDFSKKSHFGLCADCGRKECFDCMPTCWCFTCCKQFCDDCKGFVVCRECQKNFCSDCNDDFTSCEHCKQGMCSDCNVMFSCEGCSKSFCLECEELFFCDECDKTFCLGCRDSVFSCTQCEADFCLGCRKSVACAGECDNTFCSLKCQMSSTCCCTKS
jgi:hypothetical protein